MEDLKIIVKSYEDIYDEIDIEDMYKTCYVNKFKESTVIYSFQCPCGDVFTISSDELKDGEEIAHCDSCTLILRVIYDQNDFMW